MNPRRLLLALCLSGVCEAGCFDVEGDRILAGDLALAWKEFASIPSDTAVAFAPVPGAQRIFRLPELRRLATRYAVPLTIETDLCFERPMEALTSEKILRAMPTTPEFAEARIDVLEFSRYPVPRGDVEFPRAGLGAPATRDGAVLWKGYVRYGGDHRFAIWARVKISLPLRRVIAVERLKPGVLIEESQIRLETYIGFPPRQKIAQDIREVAGRLAHRSIPAGGPIALADLELPREVARGDVVDVETSTGAAKITLRGRAESGGRSGDTVSVRNLQSGRTFRARVESKGKVIVNGGAK